MKGDGRLYRKTVSGMLLVVLIIGFFVPGFIVHPVRASETIYIRSDGSVDPPAASISSIDNVTYTITADINDSIRIERDDIVVDGNGHVLQSSAYTEAGIDLSWRNNVTVKNVFYVKGFRYGIFLNYSTNSVLTNNTMKENYMGIYLGRSSQNTITNNTVRGNYQCRSWGQGAVYLFESTENLIKDNVVVQNEYFSWSSGHIVAIGIHLNFSNANTVTNNVVTRNNGLLLLNSSDNVVSENIVQKYSGISLYSYSCNNNIARNNITDNDVGVALYSNSSANEVIGNNITRNGGNGIYLAGSQNNIFHDNLLNDNTYGLTVESSSYAINDYSHSIDTSNMINGKPIYYLVDQHGLVVNPSTCPQIGYLALVNCTDITVENADLRNNYKGLMVINTNNSRIVNSNVANNIAYGFYLLKSYDNLISGDNISNTYSCGLFAFRASGNTMSGNTVTNNSIGIYLSESNNNIVSDNAIATNTNRGIWLIDSANNLFLENNISNNSKSGISITESAHSSKDNVIANNNITENDYGIESGLSGYLPHAGTNFTIENNNVKGNTNAGILLYGITDSTISDNVVTNNKLGIYIAASRSSIRNNTVSNNTENGIYLSSVWSSGYELYGSHNTLFDNHAENNGKYGIFLTTSENTLSENAATFNKYNFGVEWESGHGLSNYVDSSNSVDGKPVYYWLSQNNKVVPKDAGCVIIVSSINITVEDVLLTRNHVGILMANTKNSTIKNVTSTSNYDGIALSLSTYDNISGNAVKNNDRNGIYLHSRSSNNVIGENDVEGNSGGIFLSESHSNILSGNIVANNGYGIRVYGSNNNFLSDNIISESSGEGISIDGQANTLTGNLLNANRFCLNVLGTTLNNYMHSIDTSNLINGNPVYYWINERNKEVPSNAGYIALINSTRITVKNQVLANNGQGVLIAYTNDSRIVNNNIADNSMGINLFRSQGNFVFGNNITRNEGRGVSLDYSSRNNIIGNSITNNDYGVYFKQSASNNSLSENTIADNDYYGVYSYASDNNTIYHNNFIHNYISQPQGQAGAYVGRSIWDDGYPSGGNYWSDYKGVDTHSGPYQNETGIDGIGDTPYYIRVGSYGGYGQEPDRYPLMNPFVPPVMGVSDEKSFIESSFVETLRVQKGTLDNVIVSGDLNGTLGFTNFEIVNITTGSFAGKGFSKGEWEATLEGTSYKGDWRGALFLKPSESKIYLKGAVSGEISGILDGYLTETVPGSGIYDQYQATWKIGRVYTTTTSVTVNLNGTLAYQSDSEFPSTELYMLQTSVEGAIFGDYNCSLSAVLTNVQVTSGTPYDGEGFSIISYTSDVGAGEGWTYDCLASPGIMEMKGLFTSPLLGKVSATLDETTSPRSLLTCLERVDLGLPLMADLKVKIWGPQRASPGQTITYVVEVRNDGLESAENITVANELPWQVDYVSNTGGGVYKPYFREVDWLLNLPAKSVLYLTTEGRVMWGLPQGAVLGGFAKILGETEVETDATIETTYEIIESSNNYSKVKVTIGNQSETVAAIWEISTTEVTEKIEPTIEVNQISEDSVEIVYKFIVIDIESGLQEEIAVKLIENIGALDKLLGFSTRLPEYVEKTAKFELQQDWVNNLYQKGKISEELWKKLQFINEGEYILQTISKECATLSPISGNSVSPMTWDEPMRRFVQHYRWTAIAVEDIDLFLDLYDTMHQSQIAVARDPNVKYGPEGYVSPSQTLNYTIEYENEGAGTAFGVYLTDMLDQNLDDSDLNIGPVVSTKDGSIIAGPGTYNPSTRTITWLVGEVGSGEGGFAKFSIKVRDDVSLDTEIINFGTVYFPSVPETTRTNAIVSVVGQPNIAVTNVMPLEPLVEKGSVLRVDVAVANEGYLPETFNLTLYANATTIQTQAVTLIGRSSDTVIFLWNTTSFVSGNYTISAYAMPVSGETEIEDNFDMNGPVQVKILDDVPPVTVLNVGEPRFSMEGTVCLTSHTPILLTAQDDPSGSGVAQKDYRIYNSTYDSGWMTCTETFNLAGLYDGTYFVDYCSIDNAGNIEPTNTAIIILDNTPPTTTTSIGQPKCVADKTYVTRDTPFALEADDVAGSGIYSIDYRISNSTYDSGWLPYTPPFRLVALSDGVYTISFNATDNVGNMEAAKSIQVTLFSWICTFADSYGRGTALKINAVYKLFQFITPDTDYGIRKATYMKQSGRAIIISHLDKQLQLITIAVDTNLDFCVATAWDRQTRKQYVLIDKPGIEK
jgi:uncharacterized repeat protein (TIGR01451 family)